MVQSGRLEGWRPDADLYEQLIAWMCTQEDLVDVAEQIVRQELPVRGWQIWLSCGNCGDPEGAFMCSVHVGPNKCHVHAGGRHPA